MVKCVKCGAYNDRSDKAQEWEFMSPVRRICHIMLALVWAVIYGVAFALLFALLASFVATGSISTQAWGAMAALHPWAMAILGLIAGLLVSFTNLVVSILASKGRVANPDYRLFLRRMGHGENGEFSGI
jgi:hypothetical protein